MALAPTAPEKKPVLGYWDIRGVASQIRYELVYLSVDFEETRYPIGEAPGFDRSSWLSKKDSLGLVFPNLPYFIDGASRLSDVKAIMKLIACKYGPALLGDTAQRQGEVEMVAQVVSDIKAAVTMPCYTSGDRVAITMDLLERVKPIVVYLGSKHFLCGDQVTYPDFILFELCDFMQWLS